MNIRDKKNILAILLVLAGTMVAAGVVLAKPAAKARTVDIQITKSGFEPGGITVDKGEPVKLVFTRKTDETCAKKVVVHLGDGKKVEKALPLDQAVVVEGTFTSTGTLRYACGMDMIKGVVTVR